MSIFVIDASQSIQSCFDRLCSYQQERITKHRRGSISVCFVWPGLVVILLRQGLSSVSEPSSKVMTKSYDYRRNNSPYAGAD